MPSKSFERNPEVVDEWEDANAGLGDNLDLEVNEPFVGFFLGTGSIPLKDSQHPGQMRDAKYHQFAPVDEPEKVVFLWGSKQLDDALMDDRIAIGDKLRVIYLGTDQFKSPDGPRVIKRYRVQFPKTKV